MIGSRSPGVAGHVGGEGYIQTEHLGETVQVLVVPADSRVVLLVRLFDVGTGENGKQVGTSRHCVLVDKRLHLRLYLHLDILSCLPALINDATMLDVLPLQVSEIDKGESTGAEAEDERVA